MATNRKTQCWAHRGFKCLDCNVCTLHMPEGAEYYMVQDAIWSAVGIAPDDGMLCIACLEKRLGRELNAKDFTNVLLNEAVKAGGWDATELLVGRINRE